jgi:hypothetical protein
LIFRFFRLIDSVIIYLRTDSMMNKERNTHMSSLAISALEDFSRILRILKKESMTESDFIMILYGAGIQDASIAKEAFAKLTMQCGLALEKEIDSIDVTALKALYESSPYQDCESSN